MSLPYDEWIKSSKSNPSGNCVEVKREIYDDGEDLIRIRDSVAFERGVWAAINVRTGAYNDFIAGVKAGEFDL